MTKCEHKERYQKTKHWYCKDCGKRVEKPRLIDIDTLGRTEEKPVSYCWGFTEECCYGFGNSLADCAKEAEEYCDTYKMELPETIYIGEFVPYDPSIDGKNFLLDMAERAWDDYEYAEGWLEYVTKEQADDLEKRLNKVLLEWLKETGNEPNFGDVVNVQRYDLKTAIKMLS